MRAGGAHFLIPRSNPHLTTGQQPGKLSLSPNLSGYPIDNVMVTRIDSQKDVARRSVEMPSTFREPAGWKR
jgi:hypothetical protein